MSRRRRAALLLGLALVLGGLAASDVARREAVVRDQLAPLTDVLVARAPLDAGHRLSAADLGMRRVPARFAPPGGVVPPEALLGARLAVPVAAGGSITPLLVERPKPAVGAPVRAGERAAEVVASGAPEAVLPGARVDVLVTRERGDGAGAAELALEDVEVLAARPAPHADGARAPAGPRISATLRVTVRQAVYLAAAQAFAGEIRLLARAPGDRRRAGPLSVGASLE